MANLYFPQLSSGALAQYPIKKTKRIRTIQNVLPDGSIFQLPDPAASLLSWQLSYADLSQADLAAIQAHYQACAGPYRAFTFIDPTGNMLVYSSDLTTIAWLNPGSLRIESGFADSMGGTQAFQLTNVGQVNQALSQIVNVPANYQYCFSMYVCSAVPSIISIVLSGSSATNVQTFTVGTTWTRIVSNSRLNDPGTSFTVGLEIGAGQEVQVFAPQLEAQIAPSTYRPTGASGGVYANAHFASNQLPVIAEAPNLFTTSFSIEAVV